MYVYVHVHLHRSLPNSVCVVIVNLFICTQVFVGLVPWISGVATLLLVSGMFVMFSSINCTCSQCEFSCLCTLHVFHCRWWLFYDYCVVCISTHMKENGTCTCMEKGSVGFTASGCHLQIAPSMVKPNCFLVWVSRQCADVCLESCPDQTCS